MADAHPATAETSGDESQPKKKGSLFTIILLSIISVVSAAGGFAVPLLFPQMVGGESVKPAKSHGEVPKLTRPVFMQFDELVVNLNSERFNRYLKLAISLQVDESQQQLVNEKLLQRKVRLKSWLISYLSDKSMDEIRGAAGQNRMRREIQDHFNSELFDDGYDRITDILFEEFNVQ